MKDLLTVKGAADWASNYLGRSVSPSNISYLVQYAKVKKYSDTSNSTVVNRDELKQYYDHFIIKKEKQWKNKLGEDLDWSLSFDNLRESETTKHVHRLHPYKGKFIPQLVEYFLDDHKNTHKKEAYFMPGDTVLDPFMGSGTMLVQAKEIGINSIGIDISKFNCLIAEVKLGDYNFQKLSSELRKALETTENFSKKTFDERLEIELKNRIQKFNNQYFPNPGYKRDIQDRKINEEKYSNTKLREFLGVNKELLEKLISAKAINNGNGFLSKWYSPQIREELFEYTKMINGVGDEKIRKVMQVIISRTARSCRATTHSDLATLKEPQYLPYYCKKHKKICTPINSVLKHLSKNTFDTIYRLNTYSKLKKKASSVVVQGDSRKLDIIEEVKKYDISLAKQIAERKIDGVFTSPPYVGQIDYHEQHAYAYELFDIKRNDDLEIGPMNKGYGINAKEEYINGISNVLKNISRFVKDDGNFFIVANDKNYLYPKIAEMSGLKIVDRFKRPVLNRTERDRTPYCETIFHMRKL
jgi:DNA modification methylase